MVLKAYKECLRTTPLWWKILHPRYHSETKETIKVWAFWVEGLKDLLQEVEKGK